MSRPVKIGFPPRVNTVSLKSIAQIKPRPSSWPIGEAMPTMGANGWDLFRLEQEQP